MKLFNVLLCLTMLFAYLASNVECRRSSDIIIFGKGNSWGGSGSNL